MRRARCRAYKINRLDHRIVALRIRLAPEKWKYRATSKTMPIMATALIAGSTGLVGSHLLWLLCQDERYTQVTALIRRRPVPFSHPKLTQKLTNFTDLDSNDAGLTADHVFCCLGTTIKSAGSQERFRTVDHDFCLKLAQIAKDRGARKFLIVTALGADAASQVFYSRVKGEIERDVRALGIPEVHFFRPSLLDGNRAEKRLGEKIALAFARPFSFLLMGRLKRYRPVRIEWVAQSMIREAVGGAPGDHIHESESLHP